jgi:hypothetical protein
MKIIKKDDTIVALVFDGKFENGTNPLTDEKWPLQILALKHPKGKILAAHFHKPTSRTTENFMEFLAVLSGIIQITVYYFNEPIENVRLTAGQGIMLVNGGFGIEVIEDAEMMEFKNGPFVEDKVLL